MRASLLSSTLLLTLVTVAAHAAPESKRERRDRQAEGAGPAVAVDASAPRPPGKDQLKKTQPGEVAKHPAKKAIRALEDLVYTMEKPTSTIWTFLQGTADERDIQYVAKQLAELDEHLAAVRAGDPAWHRLAEYERRIAYLKRAAAAQRGQRDAVAAAQQQQADDARRAAAEAWAKKRVPDEGLTHDLHRRAAGTIVFAAGELAPGNAGVATLDTVAVDAPLFARGYFKESPWNALHSAEVDCGADVPATLESYAIKTRFQVNGGGWIDFGSMALDKAAFQAKTSSHGSKHGSFTAGGTFATRDDEGMGTFRWITAVAPRLVVGTNTVQLEMAAWCYRAPHAGVPIATGTLKITATKAQLDALAGRAAFKMAPSVHPAAQLAGLRAKIVRHYEGRGYQLVDFRTASEWQPVRHATSGVILHREANAVALLRKQGTIQCELASLALQEPYDGSKYGPALNLGFASHRPFPCQVK